MKCELREMNENGEPWWCYEIPLATVLAVAYATNNVRHTFGTKSFDVPSRCPSTVGEANCPWFNLDWCAIAYVHDTVDGCEVAS